MVQQGGGQDAIFALVFGNVLWTSLLPSLNQNAKGR